MDDPDPGNLIFQIILLFVLILLNAFFAMSEIAIISLNDTKIAKMAEEGNKKAKLAYKLAENYDELISSTLVGNNVVNIAATTIGTLLFVGWLGSNGATVSVKVISRKFCNNSFSNYQYSNYCFKAGEFPSNQVKEQCRKAFKGQRHNEWNH